MKLLRLGAAFLTAAAALVPLGTAPAVADGGGCTASAKLVNSCRPWLGAAANDYSSAANTLKDQIIAHETRIGRQVDVVHNYHAVGSNTLSSDELYFAGRPNTIMYINWKPADKWADAGGGNAAVNAAIDQMASSIKAAGGQVMLTVFHEPENDASVLPSCPAGTAKGTAGTDAEYRAMWQNVRNRFDALGVSNVVWVMNYMSYVTWDCAVKDLWPGNNLVDWVTWDDYATSANPTFPASTQRFYNLLASSGDATHDFAAKPWGIAEFAVHGVPQATAYAYYDSLKTSIDTNAFPRLKLYGAFDSISSGVDNRFQYTSTGVLDQAEQDRYNTVATDPALAGSWTVATPDTSPPSALVTAPAAGGTVAGTTTVQATVQDDVGVTSAQLLVDGVATGAPVTNPAGTVSFSWSTQSVSDGSHTLGVRVADAAGNTSTSPTVTVTVKNADTTAPTTPTAVTATAGSTPLSVAVGWQPSSDDVGVTGYRISRNGAQVGSVGGTTTSYSDTVPSDASTYSYTVVAVDAAGNASGPSAPATITVADRTAPGVPTGVRTTSVGSSSATLAWTAPTDNVGVTGYTVYRNGTAVGTSATASYTDAGLTQGTTYSYTVSAYDAAGNVSAASTALPVTTTPDTVAPTTPGTLRATVKAYSVTLTWKASTDTGGSGLAGYRVYRTDKGTTTPWATVSTTTFTDTRVSARTGYTYRVVAVDGRNNASAAATVTATTAAGRETVAPTTPGNLTASAVTRTSATLRWTASTDAGGVAGYHVYANGAYLGDAPTTSFTATLLPSTTYGFTVVAFDTSANLSRTSNTATVTTPA